MRVVYNNGKIDHTIKYPKYPQNHLSQPSKTEATISIETYKELGKVTGKDTINPAARHSFGR